MQFHLLPRTPTLRGWRLAPFKHLFKLLLTDTRPVEGSGWTILPTPRERGQLCFLGFPVTNVYGITGIQTHILLMTQDSSHTHGKLYCVLGWAVHRCHSHYWCDCVPQHGWHCTNNTAKHQLPHYPAVCLFKKHFYLHKGTKLGENVIPLYYTDTIQKVWNTVIMLHHVFTFGNNGPSLVVGESMTLQPLDQLLNKWPIKTATLTFILKVQIQAVSKITNSKSMPSSSIF